MIDILPQRDTPQVQIVGHIEEGQAPEAFEAMVVEAERDKVISDLLINEITVEEDGMVKEDTSKML